MIFIKKKKKGGPDEIWYIAISFLPKIMIWSTIVIGKHNQLGLRLFSSVINTIHSSSEHQRNAWVKERDFINWRLGYWLKIIDICQFRPILIQTNF